MFRRTSAHVSLFLTGILLLHPKTAGAIDPGEYSGDTATSEGLTLSVKPKSARVQYIGDMCVGEAEGTMNAVGTGHWKLRANEMPECVIDFKQEGSRITVKEGMGCIGLHGVSCSFDGTLIAKAGVKLAGGGGPASSKTSAVPIGTWTYDIDPVLGLSAHIRTDDGAVGIACISDGSNPAVAEILSVRITNELVKAHGSLYMFEGKDGGRSVVIDGGRPYAEVRDNTCGISLASFRAAQSMILANGTITAVNAAGPVAEVTIDQAGTQTVISGNDDLASKLGGKSISLKGSAAAINALLRACPAAQRDIEDECGI